MFNVNKGSRWKNKLTFLSIFISILYLLAVMLPFIDAYVIRPVSFDRQIDPEFFNGLLTASSILFGFSSLLAVSQKTPRKHMKILWLILLPPLFLIISSVGAITEVALGHMNGVNALLILTASFFVNALSTGFLVGFIIQRLWEKNPRKTES